MPFWREEPGTKKLREVEAVAAGTGVNGGDWAWIEPAVYMRRKNMRWEKEWAAGIYDAGDVVVDDGYLAIATTETTDRPSPQPTGPAAYVYDGSSPTGAITAKSLLVAAEYTFPEAFTFNGYRFYTVVGNEYAVYYSINGVVRQLLTITATATGWQEFNAVGAVVDLGDVFILGVNVVEPDPTPTTWTGDWNYQTPNNEGVPGIGAINHANRLPSSFRIHKTDSDLNDRSADLATMQVGDVIDGAGVRWAIQSITDNGTWIDFGVAPASQGAPDGDQTFTFETVTATPITTVRDTDYFLGNASVQSFYRIDGGSDVLTDDALGVDINLTPVSASPDWDILATSSAGTGGGSGGTDLFTGLLDTPSDYTGHAGKNVTVKGDQTGLEFTNQGAIPHSGLTGLTAGDDHTQYLNTARHDAITGNPHGVTAAEAGADPAGSSAGVQSNLDAHTGDTSNPHAVTAAQAGADPAGSAGAVQTDLDGHKANTSNPHAVTAAQAGADPAGSADAVQAGLDFHTAQTNNPHNVTAAQAGADPSGTASAAVAAHEAAPDPHPAYLTNTEHGNIQTNPHNVTAAQTGADPAGSAAAVQAGLDAHTGDAGIHFADAPSDGTGYVRKDGGWEAQASSGGGFGPLVEVDSNPTAGDTDHMAVMRFMTGPLDVSAVTLLGWTVMGAPGGSSRAVSLAASGATFLHGTGQTSNAWTGNPGQTYQIVYMGGDRFNIMG